MNTTNLFKNQDWPLFENILTESMLYPNYTLGKILSTDPNPAILNQIYQNTSYFLNLHHDNLINPISFFLTKFNKDISLLELNVYFQKSGYLTLSEINQLILSFEFFNLINSYQQFPFDFNIDAKDVRLLNHFIKTQFRSFVSEDGGIDYFKHPKLEKIYKNILHLESLIRQQLNALQNSPNFSPYLQFKGIDVINGRYILSVKSDSFNSHMGHILGKSDSKNTLYIEPFEIVELNRNYKSELENLQNQLDSLAFEITTMLKNYSNLLSQSVQLLYFVDEYLSRSTFALQLNLTRPQINDNQLIEVTNFYHPLIKNCIRNSLRIDPKSKGLIISGPNTGGKTVILKSIALIVEFAKLGLFVPATHADVFLFDNVHFFSSDYQNLESGLSSFSGEMVSYFSTFDFQGTCLILIDEIFKSTSSEEASALAISFLEQWCNTHNKYKIILSTHHQMLKTYLHTDQRFLSSHVGFDLNSNKPTYKLIIGSPGNSYALKILENLNFDPSLKDKIIQKALTVLDHKQINYEKLLQNVTEKTEKLDRLLEENSELNKQLKNQKSAQEGLWKLKLNQMIDEYQKNFEKLISDTLHRLETTENLNKRKVDIARSETIKHIHSYSPQENVQNTLPDYPFEKPKEIIVGQYYYYPQLKKDVLVLNLDHLKNEVSVSIGNFKLKCQVRDLYVSRNIKNNHKVHIHIEKSKSSPLEIDCRGMRLEEFQHTVEKAISDLGIDLIPFVTIIHGHGDGILKKWLREYLKKNDGFKVDDDDSGNDGQTRITKS